MANFDFSFGDLGAFVDIPSPAESLDNYDNVEPYLETSASESHSPIEPPFNAPYFPEIAVTGALPSPATTPAMNAAPEEAPAEGEEKKPAKKPAPKRKRENRYKNAPPAVLSRRRAQNRASQRAYRERKDQRIRDLEALLEEEKQKNEQLSQAYDSLQADYAQLVKSRASHSQRNHSQPQASLPYDMMVMGGHEQGQGQLIDGLGLYGYQHLAGFPM